MSASTSLPPQYQLLADYLRQHHASRIGVFGSRARGEHTAASDLDVWVRFAETPSLLQLVRMERELSELVNCKVDLVTEGALQNPKLRQSIEQDLQIIYE